MAEIEAAERASELSTRRILNLLRQGFDTAELLLNITGVALDASYSLIAQSAFTAAETIININTALAATAVGSGIGVFAIVQAGAGFAAAAGLFVQGFKILGKKDADLQQLRQITAFTNMWRLR